MKRALHSMKSAIYSVKRALYSVKRALCCMKRDDVSVIRTLILWNAQTNRAPYSLI